jgi:hypothetical protein
MPLRHDSRCYSGDAYKGSNTGLQSLFAHLHVNKDAAPEMYRLSIQADGLRAPAEKVKLSIGDYALWRRDCSSILTKIRQPD